MCFNPKETPEVTCLEWSPVYQDLIAVGIGSFDVLNANTPGGWKRWKRWKKPETISSNNQVHWFSIL